MCYSAAFYKGCQFMLVWINIAGLYSLFSNNGCLVLNHVSCQSTDKCLI